jgi:hypothetical protein
VSVLHAVISELDGTQTVAPLMRVYLSYIS